MMLEALGVSEANAPLSGRRMLSASFGSVGIVRQARPRSAVTVSPTAPGLAPLTGFSRSGSRSQHLLRSECRPNRHFALLSGRGLEACASLSVKVAALTLTRPPSARQWTGVSSCRIPAHRDRQTSSDPCASDSRFCTSRVHITGDTVENSAP